MFHGVETELRHVARPLARSLSRVGDISRQFNTRAFVSRATYVTGYLEEIRPGRPAARVRAEQRRPVPRQLIIAQRS